jgi:hypothetical protein
MLNWENTFLPCWRQGRQTGSSPPEWRRSRQRKPWLHTENPKLNYIFKAKKTYTSWASRGLWSQEKPSTRWKKHPTLQTFKNYFPCLSVIFASGYEAPHDTIDVRFVRPNVIELRHDVRLHAASRYLISRDRRLIWSDILRVNYQWDKTITTALY